ncbi:hypothetical protein D3C83_95250 [compost metagenome]
MAHLIELVAAVDGLLQTQAGADTDYFVKASGRSFTPTEIEQIRAVVLYAYRWQYISSGVQDERFQKILAGMITSAQMERIGTALAPIMQ